MSDWKYCMGCGRALEPGASCCAWCGRQVPTDELSGERHYPQVMPAPVREPGPTGMDSPATGTGEWLVILLLLGIPFVNLVLLLVWAFGGSTSPSKRNFSRAVLILFLVAVVVWLVSFFAGLAILGSNPDLERRILELLGQ